MGMTWDALAELGVRLPEVVRDIWFRTPALKVRGKSFVRLKEDGKSVVFLLESVDGSRGGCDRSPSLWTKLVSWLADSQANQPISQTRYF